MADRKPKPRVILSMYRQRLVFDGDCWVRMEVEDGKDRMGATRWKDAVETDSEAAQVIDRIGLALVAALRRRTAARKARRG